MKYRFFNEDCISGCRNHIETESVDLIVTDPPYGIEGDKLEKHYSRNENLVIDGYVEIPASEYPEFSVNWIREAERILKPGGSIYIVSGYTNLIHILDALKQTQLKEINHLIWKLNFGVYTKNKYISSHYHILYYRKKGKQHTFNTFVRFSNGEKSQIGGSANYSDREDVWIINREFKPGQTKNKNELPTELLIKMIQYSSNEGDLVCDLFLGSFSTAKVAKGLKRRFVGFELSQNSFDYQIKEFEKLEVGYLSDQIRKPKKNVFINQGKPISNDDLQRVRLDHESHLQLGMTKKKSIKALSKKYGRGNWSIQRILERTDIKENIETESGQSELTLPKVKE